MINDVKFSIIIPVYNGEKYIEKSINSVLDNECNNYEIIVVNDGSNDNTENIIKKIQRNNKNRKIKYFRKENSGVSSARNLGIDKAIGDYILFLDSDDEFENNLIDAVNLITEKYKERFIVFNRKDLIDSKEKCILINEKEIKMYNKDEYIISRFALAYHSCFLVTNKIYWRESIIENNIKFKEDIQLSEDLVFNFEYIRCMQNVLEIPNIFYLRHYHNNSTIIKNIENYFEKNIKVIDDYLSDIYPIQILRKVYIHFAFISIDRLVNKMDFNTNLERAHELKKIKKFCKKQGCKLKYKTAKKYKLYSKIIMLNELAFLYVCQLIFKLRRLING